jgi:hypothetical protein
MADVKRNPDGTWPPGVSANPGGRSKKLKLFCEFLDSVDPKSETPISRRQALWDRLYETGLNGKGNDSNKAIELISAYDMGKPVLMVAGPDGGPIQTLDVTKLTAEQLEQYKGIIKTLRGE